MKKIVVLSAVLTLIFNLSFSQVLQEDVRNTQCGLDCLETGFIAADIAEINGASSLQAYFVFETTYETCLELNCSGNL